MKVLVTGADGQLGRDVMLQLKARGHEAVGADIDEMDITNLQSVQQFLTLAQPDAVIHCAAWTAVDLAEDEPECCRQVNANGTANVAQVCAQLGCKLLYLSTDYVFSGCGDAPWQPDCRDFAPCNVYGRTKLDGEAAIRACMERFFIVRISWVFGKNGKNFVKTMLELANRGIPLQVVDDQIGNPTYTVDLARLLIDMVQSDQYGCYHVSNEGPAVSWYDYACEIFRQSGVRAVVSPVHSEAFPTKAARPKNSRLDRSKLVRNGFTPLPDWRDALTRFLEENKRK